MKGKSGGESEESDESVGTGMGGRKEKVWRGLEEKDVIINWLVGSVISFGTEIWGWKE